MMGRKSKLKERVGRGKGHLIAYREKKLKTEFVNQDRETEAEHRDCVEKLVSYKPMG